MQPKFEKSIFNSWNKGFNRDIAEEDYEGHLLLLEGGRYSFLLKK